MKNEEKTKENSDGDPFVAEEAERLKTMNITDRLTNSAAIISTLCRRMLNNKQVDDIIRYNLEIILEEIDKIEEVVREFRTSAECGEKRSGNESREVEEGEERKNDI
jgi:hypothetical protein